MADITESSAREIRAGRLIAISSFIFCILLIIHHFVVLDETTAKSLLSLAGQKTSDTAVHNILNSDRYTGVMYILALAGVVALWNRHPYLWWFMFAVYVSNALFTLVNLYMFVQAILDVKNVIAILPILIVVIGSIVLAIYMLVVSIARKSTFNR